MSRTVAILAPTHIVRQSVAQALAPLGFLTGEFTDLAELALGVNRIAPRLVVVDIDGLEGRWQALAAALRGSPQRPALILLAARFGFEEAHEALALGVAGMILKPFRKEDHTARLSDLFLKSLDLHPRRAAPRFVPPRDGPAYLRYQGPRGEQKAELAGLSLGGLSIRAPMAAAEKVFQRGLAPGRMTLLLERAEVPLSVQVIHGDAETIGLRILRLYGGRAAFLRVVAAQHARAFGAGGKRNRW